ncbi:hypothetical protein ACFWQL_16725 [Amycolatopsis thermoflava]|uniref:hypothetical protein n=1 Tax=Amycolatopsis thermoflava TaxID=84480 RepID=UPI0036560198
MDRLRVIMWMKPLGSQLDEMREVLAIIDPTPDALRVEDPAGRPAELTRTADERRCAASR